MKLQTHPLAPDTSGAHANPATSTYAWVVFALTFGLMLSDYLSRQVIGAVFPFIKADWGVSDALPRAGAGGLCTHLGPGARRRVLAASRATRPGPDRGRRLFRCGARRQLAHHRAHGVGGFGAAVCRGLALLRAGCCRDWERHSVQRSGMRVSYSSGFSCCSSVGSSSLTVGWMGIARESMV